MDAQLNVDSGTPVVDRQPGRTDERPIGASRWELSLLGRWQLRTGGRLVDVAPRQRRIISVLALVGSQSRRVLAATLWPTSAEPQAAGNLRSGLWQVNHQLPNLISSAAEVLSLDPNVAVDLHHVHHRIGVIKFGIEPPDPDDVSVLGRSQLLPGWYDDWVLVEQERFNVLRMEALETLARRFFERGERDDGFEAALAAAAIEPLRECAHRLIIEGHLQAGNYDSAVHAYNDFRTRLTAELGVPPSRQMSRLIAATPSPL